MQFSFRTIRGLLWTAALLVTLSVTVGCLRSPQEKYDAFMKDGKAYMEKQDYASAVLQFRNAARAMPDKAEPLYQAALCELRQGRGTTAYNLSKKAEQLDPKHKDNEMLLAQLMVLISANDKQFASQAEQRLQALRNANPQDPNVLYLLAATKASVNDPIEMEKFLMEALQNSPQHLQSSLALARSKLIKKDYDGAREVLKKAVADAPDSVEPKLALGQLYIVLKQFPLGAQQFQDALKIDPQSGQALIGLAILAEQDGKKDESEQLMQKAAALPDKRYKAFYGRLLMQHEKYDASIAEFKRLLDQDPANPDFRAMLVAAYVEAKRQPEGEAYLRQYVADHTDDRTARAQLVSLLVSQNKAADAEAVLNQAIQKNPKDVDALLQRTEIYWRTNRIQQAEGDLTNILQERPNESKAHYFLAKLHETRSEMRLYQQELTEAVRLQPDFLMARLDLANAMRASGDAKAALTLLDEAPAINQRMLAFVIARNWALIQSGHPDARLMVDRTLENTRLPEVLLQDGFLKERDKQYAAARASYEEVLKQDPDNLRALGSVANTYVKENKSAEATDAIRRHVATKPDSAPLQHFLGTWYVHSGYRTEARQAFQAALKANPNFIPAQLSLGQLDLSEGKFDDARRSLQAVLAADPNNATAMVYLGMTDDAAGKYDAAIANYQKALALDPEGPLAVITLNNLAYRLSETRNALDEALTHAQRAKELAPENREVDDTLGWIYYRKGIYSTALQYLESAATSEQGKKNALIHYHLAICQLKAGEVDQGRQTLQMAKSLDPNLPEAAAADQLVRQLATQ